MKVILLAAGLGTRLKPITDKTPKCLVLINGKPLMKIWIESLLRAGIKDILINTHYMPDAVQDFLKKEGYYGKVKISHEPVLLGTAGTLLKNIDFIGDSSVMVIHADNLSKCNLGEFIEAHKKRPKNCNMTMMLFRSDNPASCGIVKTNDDGIVTAFYEKMEHPPSNLANAAVYIFESLMIKGYLNKSTAVTDISTQIIPDQLGNIYTYFNKYYHRDIGTPSSLELANEEFEES